MRIVGFLLLLAGILPALGEIPLTPVQQGARAFQTGNWPEAKSIFLEVLSGDPSNTTAKNYLNKIEQKEAVSAAVNKRLESIIIPELVLRDTSLNDALDHLAIQTREISKGSFSLNFVRLFSNEQGQTRVQNLQLRQIPLSEVLNYLGAATKMRFVPEAHAIRVFPIKTPGT